MKLIPGKLYRATTTIYYRNGSPLRTGSIVMFVEATKDVVGHFRYQLRFLTLHGDILFFRSSKMDRLVENGNRLLEEAIAA